MPIGYLSDQTTVLSNLSLTGNFSALTYVGSLNNVSNLSASTVTLNTVSSVTVIGTGIVKASTLTVGSGQTIGRISQGTFSVAALTVTGNKSLSTDAAIAGLTVTDVVMATPGTSGLSNGLTYNTVVTSAGTLTIYLSNASSATAAQIASTWKYVSIGN